MTLRQSRTPWSKLTPAQKRNRYVRGQLLPRWKEVFASWRLYLPCALGVALAFGLPQFCTIGAEIAAVASIGLNYAAISFGACITGAVLAIGLPSEERVGRWASQVPRGRSFSTYSDLVFALTWSAFAQLAVLVVSIVSVVAGGDIPLLPADPWLSHRLLLAGALAVFFYGVMQLLILVSTISQLGNVIDAEERRRAKSES